MIDPEMDINVQLLKKLSETAGAPGFEKRVRDVVIEQVRDLVDEFSIDNLGNLICLKKGNGNKKIMAAAHLDEIGFMVTHIDEEGFINFQPLGGFDPKTLTAQRVIVHGKKDLIGIMGSKPIHAMSSDERNKAPLLTDYFIDLGLSAEEVHENVSIGDSITREREMIEMGDCVNGKSIDNRVAVFILIECLRLLKDVEVPYDFYAVFTVQEEVGIRGANVAAHRINPDFGIAIDTTVAYDLPGAKPHEKITLLGKGTGIKVMDGMTICDPRMVAFMKSMADNHDINYQLEVLPGGGTDTAGVQRMGKQGAIAGAISIPTRNLHQVIEMAHKADIDKSIQLLTHCVKQMDQHDWSH